MNENSKQQHVRSKKTVIKAIILAAFIIGAIFLVQFTPAKNYLTSEFLNRFLGKAGFWAPFIYILFYVARICLFVPGTLLTGIGAAIFGAYWGFCMFGSVPWGASIAFFIGRTIGRDFAASLIGNKI